MPADSPGIRVFISYSRKDMDAATELRDRLIEAGFDAFLDVHDIVKGEPWQDRLRGLIESSDTVAFLISPNSVASDICAWEVNAAELQEKRVLPVVVRTTPTDSIPERLQRLNFTFLETRERWESEFPLLIAALNEDVEWTREHTRLGELALRWERGGRPGRLLLRGADLDGAERWRDQRPATAPALSALHTALLSESRLGARRRMRNWFASVSVLAVLALALSTFAYWQRGLAISNGAIAERRAATLATDVAIAQARDGAFNVGMLMLLDASTRYGDEPIPEKLLLGLRDTTTKARRSRRFWFSAGSRAFHLPGVVAVVDPVRETLYAIHPATGEREQIAAIGGHDVRSMTRAGDALVYVTGAQNVYRVPLGGRTGVQPELLVALLQPGEKPLKHSSPEVRTVDAGTVLGERLVQLADGKTFRSELWRVRLSDSELKRFERSGIPGRWYSTRPGFAYFWNRRDGTMRAADLSTGVVTPVSRARAVELGIAPCRNVVGKAPAAHVEQLYATVKPGLEEVKCAGLYGSLALVGQTRALARDLMDEFYLFPAGATADQARNTYWLEAATERLGSLGKRNPYAWHAGSADGALVAVAHADTIMVLGLKSGQFLKSALYADQDNVARELTTPDVSDGGRFHGGTLLSYSGPDADRYQVTLAQLSATDPLREAAGPGPSRAYWGSCGVQRPSQGDGTYDQHTFSVQRDGGGQYRITAGSRTLAVQADELKCASLTRDGERLAVVDKRGLSLYAVKPDGDAPAELLAQIGDPSIDTVSFAGHAQEILLTAHDYKVLAWRQDARGTYTARTALKSNDYVIFAEGAPASERMLVWYGLSGASAIAEVLPIEPSRMKWVRDGPYMLVGNPDVFFDANGGVFRHEQRALARLLAPVTMDSLRREALSALSPSCLPAEAGNYRSSSCWPDAF